MKVDESIETIVARKADAPVPPEVAAMAEAAREPYGDGVLAVLAYGSSLRGVDPKGTLIDLYVLVSRPGEVSLNPVARLACSILPPNVHYAEKTWKGAMLRAKVAVLTLDAFERRCRGGDNPYFWARFSQPCRLVFARDADVRRRVVAALAAAVRVMLAEASGLASPDDPPTLWEAAFRETYRTELRPEGPDRARDIVAADLDYYRTLAIAEAPGSKPASRWPRRRVIGKSLSVLRLMKAAFTFRGGADYLAWKISRHSGVTFDLKPWQRRHPILGALSLLPNLLRKGAVR